MTKLSIPQLRAIKKEVYLGRILQREIPEIAEDYRNGLSKIKIVEKYDIEERYNIGNNIAQNAVSSALKGHNGCLGVKDYEGLISNKNELEKLASEHQAIAFNSLSKKQRIANGKKAYKLGLGIHGYTKDQRIETSRKGGVIARDKNLGFHALTQEQKKENRIKAIIASGKTPYIIEEKERIFELADNPDYQNGKRGPSYKKIKNQINKEFHNGDSIRTRSSINYVLFRG